MTFTSTDPVNHKGKTNTWLTPLHIVRALGEFDLDPCGFPNHKTAKKLICLPTDGLKSKWSGRVWLNPPYGDEAKAWLLKLQGHGVGTALVFARLETRWIQPFLNNGFFMIEGRLKFLDSQFNEQGNAGVGSILIPFGPLDRSILEGAPMKGRYFK